MPRIFPDDIPEDHAAIQPVLNQIMMYLLTQFDGKMKSKRTRYGSSAGRITFNAA